MIERLNADAARALRADFIALLQDAVHHGASVGFMSPLDASRAGAYWDEVFDAVAQGSRVLLVTRRDGALAGSVQLDLCQRENGRGRAEVQKLFVHTRFRHQGLARALMAALEQEAVRARRNLLVLDTQPDQPAERLYERLGWMRVGEIPAYARSPDGELHGTVIFYRQLKPVHAG